MHRREFVAGVIAAAMPLAAGAQQASMPVVGFLRSTTRAGSVHLIKAFQQGLNEAGFVEGHNVVIEYRFGDNQHERIPTMAAELVGRPVNVIIANGLAIPAAKAATTTIPIVFTSGFDPVRTGLVASLSRPEGNVTGVVFTVTDLAAKTMGLLHELVPKDGAFAVLGDPTQPELDIELRELTAAARTIGRQLLIVRAINEREINAAFATFANARVGALLVRGGPVFLNVHRQIVELVARHALPAIYVSREYPDAGGLMSYGPNLPDAHRRAGVYVGRILKGAKPTDLPVEMASKFEFVLNMKAAKALGLEIPMALLGRADELIE